MTPSEELKAAADKVRELALAAGGRSWSYDKDQGFLDDGEASIGAIYDDDCGRHVSVWDPPTALLVAAIFDKWAWMGDHDPDLLHRIGGPETLILAKSINEEAMAQ